MSKLLNGIRPPHEDLETIESHWDLIDPKPEMIALLRKYGYEDDPFSVFFPPQYTHHLTGRVLVPKHLVPFVMVELREMRDFLLEKMRACGAEGYCEIELVKGDVSIPVEHRLLVPMLDDLSFRPVDSVCGADIHIEFNDGTVTSAVRSYLASKGAYWVKCPDTTHFPAEEIATFQVSAFSGGKAVFERLVEKPLPYQKRIILEMKPKLDGMRGTRPDLPMPEIIEVSGY